MKLLLSSCIDEQFGIWSIAGFPNLSGLTARWERKRQVSLCAHAHTRKCGCRHMHANGQEQAHSANGAASTGKRLVARRAPTRGGKCAHMRVRTGRPLTRSCRAVSIVYECHREPSECIYVDSGPKTFLLQLFAWEKYASVIHICNTFSFTKLHLPKPSQQQPLQQSLWLLQHHHLQLL